MDLCFECIERPVNRIRDQKHHTPDHPLLQTRTIAHRRHMFAVLAEAMSCSDTGAAILDSAADDDNSGPRCNICSKAMERPVWVCFDCDECKHAVSVYGPSFH